MPGQTLTTIQEDIMTTSHLDSHAILDPLSSEDDHTPPVSVQGSITPRTSSSSSATDASIDHVIKLSSIEAVMPRAYIRICFAYRIPEGGTHMQDAIAGLRRFVRQAVDAKPYLAGYVTDVETTGDQARRSEIRFSTHDFLNYPEVKAKPLENEDGSLVDYDKLNAHGCPPSRLRPEDVSALKENVGPEDRSAPTFRAQANIVRGGLIVSFWLHHCISDGTGFDLLTKGDLMNETYTFKRHALPGQYAPEGLEERLKAFADQKTEIRRRLSESPTHPTNKRRLKARRRDYNSYPQSKPGRGCVIMISRSAIDTTCEEFKASPRSGHHTKQSVLMAILWQSMTRARRPSVAKDSGILTSKLLIPVDIRKRMKEPLPEGYFGAAVDSASAELSLDDLTEDSGASLECISEVVRKAVEGVNDAYVKECIAFANSADASTDVSDIQASNMNRATGADMYITSWLKLRSYDCDLGMGFGGPDWVRKPWSRDPGSCIILPQKGSSSAYYEVVVQMTEVDMARLLADEKFKGYVIDVID